MSANSELVSVCRNNGFRIEYVRNFEQDVKNDKTSLEKKEERLEKIRRHKEKFKTGIAGP